MFLGWIQTLFFLKGFSDRGHAWLQLPYHDNQKITSNTSINPSSKFSISDYC